MASNCWFPLSLLLTIFLIHFSQKSAADVTPPRTHAMAIMKDNVKNQYYTTLNMGDSPTTVDLVIDLGNHYTWMACDHFGYKSTSYRAIPCDSPKCSAYSGPDPDCMACTSRDSPGCNLEACGGYAYTPWSNEPESSGIIEDVVYLYTRPESSSRVLQYPVPDFPFACSGKGPLEGISESAQGILTLAKVDMALHSVISKTFNVPRKFALCLPSTDTILRDGFEGALYLGGGPYYMFNERHKYDFSRLLTKTPLVTNPTSRAPIGGEGGKSVEYFINVQSINVGDTPLKLDASLLSINKDGVGGTKLSTLHPYTVMHSSIYNALVDAFTSTVKARNINRVEAIAPFGACYDSSNIAKSQTGYDVAGIDFVVEGIDRKNSRWWIPSRNSMVKLLDAKYEHVLCLGFVDGGSATTTSIVIGGKQMEDNIIEIDLESSTIGYSSMSATVNVSCSQFESTLPRFQQTQPGSLTSDM